MKNGFTGGGGLRVAATFRRGKGLLKSSVSISIGVPAMTGSLSAILVCLLRHGG